MFSISTKTLNGDLKLVKRVGLISLRSPKKLHTDCTHVKLLQRALGVCVNANFCISKHNIFYQIIGPSNSNLDIIIPPWNKVQLRGLNPICSAGNYYFILYPKHTIPTHKPLLQSSVTGKTQWFVLKSRNSGLTFHQNRP